MGNIIDKSRIDEITNEALGRNINVKKVPYTYAPTPVQVDFGSDSKYDRGIVLHSFEGADEAIKLRRFNKQTGWAMVGNTTVQTLGTITGDIVSGVGALMEMPVSIVAEIVGKDADFQNFMTRLGDNISQGARDIAPVYRKNNDYFQFGSGSWWANNIPNIFSTVSILVPAYGGIKTVQLAGKSIQILDKANKLAKIGKALQLENRVAKTAVLALNQRVIENYRESGQGYETQKAELLEKFSDPKTFDDFIHTEEGSKLYKQAVENGKSGQDLKETLAHMVASRVGWKIFEVNSTNFIFDLLQSAAFTRTLSKATATGFKSNAAIVREANMFNTGEKILKASQVIGKTAARANAIRPYSDFILGAASEGVEEIVNAIGTGEGNSYAERLLTGDKDSTFAKRLTDYLSDPSTWEQGFWGAVGGGVFQGIAAGKNAYMESKDKGGPYSDKSKEAEQLSRKVALANYLGIIKNIDRNIHPATKQPITGTDDEIALVKASLYEQAANEMSTHLALNAARSGNVDLFKAMLKGEDFKKEVANQLGENSNVSVDDVIKTLTRKVDNAVQYYDYANKIFTKRTDDSKVGEFVRQYAIGQFVKNKTTSDDFKAKAKQYEESAQSIAAKDLGIAELKAQNEQLSKEGKPTKDIDKNLENIALNKAIDGIKESAELKRIQAKINEEDAEQAVAFAKPLLDILEKLRSENQIEDANGRLTDDESEKVSDEYIEALSNKFINEALSAVWQEESNKVINDKDIMGTGRKVIDTHKKAIVNTQNNAFQKYLSTIANATENSTLEEVTAKINAVKEEKNKISKGEITHWDTNKDAKIQDSKALNAIADNTIRRLEDLSTAITKGKNAEKERIAKNDAALKRLNTITGNQDAKYSDDIVIADVFSDKNRTITKEDVEDGNQLIKDLRTRLRLPEFSSSVKQALEELSDPSIPKVIKDYVINRILTDLFEYNGTPITEQTSNKANPAITKAIRALNQTFSGTQKARFSSEVPTDIYLNFDKNSITQVEISQANDLFNEIAKALNLKATKTVKGKEVPAKINLKFDDVMIYMINAYGRNQAEEMFELIRRAYKIISVSTNTNFRTTAFSTINKLTFDKIFTKVEPFVRESEYAFTADSIVHSTGGVNAANIFLGNIKLSRDENGDLIAPDETTSSKLHTLLNELSVGDTVTLSVNTKHDSYDSTSTNPKAVPIKVTVTKTSGNEVTIGFINRTDNSIHSGIEYRLDGTDFIDTLLNDNEAASHLAKIWKPLMDWYKVAIHPKSTPAEYKEVTEALIEADSEEGMNLLEALINTHDENNTISTEELSKPLLHLARVLLFGDSTAIGMNNELDILSLRESLVAWKEKLLRDKLNHTKIRETIDANVANVIESAISYKSNGNLVRSIDPKTGERKYRLLTDTIENNPNDIHIFGLDKTGSRKIVKNLSDPTDTITLTNILNEYSGDLFIAIETPTKDASGKNTRQVVPIIHDDLQGSILGKTTDRNKQAINYVYNKLMKVVSLYDQLASSTSDEAGIINSEITKLLKELHDVIVVRNYTKAGSRFNIKFNIDNFVFDYVDKGITYTVRYDYAPGTPKSLTIKGSDNSIVISNNIQADLTHAIGFLKSNVVEERFNEATYTDPVTGKQSTYKEYIINNGIVLTDIGALRDHNGQKISNYTISNDDNIGGTPLIVNLDTSNLNNKPVSNKTIVKDIVSKYNLSNKYDFVYKMMEELVAKTGLSIIENGTSIDDDGKHGFAAYNKATNTITLDKSWHTLDSLNKTLLLAHEVIHAVTRNKNRNLSSLHQRLGVFRSEIIATSEFQSIDITKVEAILKSLGDKGIENLTPEEREVYLKASTEYKVYHVFTTISGEDIEEIITYAFTNLEVARFLNGIKSDKQYKEQPVKTFWGELKAIIEEFIGKVLHTSKLDELVNILNNTLEDIDAEISNPNPSLDANPIRVNDGTSTKANPSDEIIDTNGFDIGDLQLAKFTSFTKQELANLHTEFNNYSPNGKNVTIKRYVYDDANELMLQRKVVSINNILTERGSTYRAKVTNLAGEPDDTRMYRSIMFYDTSTNSTIHADNTIKKIDPTLPLAEQVDKLNFALLAEPVNTPTVTPKFNVDYRVHPNAITGFVHIDGVVNDLDTLVSATKVMSAFTITLNEDMFTVKEVVDNTNSISKDVLSDNSLLSTIVDSSHVRLFREFLHIANTQANRTINVPINVFHSKLNNVILRYIAANPNIKVKTVGDTKYISINASNKDIQHSIFSSNTITGLSNVFNVEEEAPVTKLVSNIFLQLKRVKYNKRNGKPIDVTEIKQDIANTIKLFTGIAKSPTDTEANRQARYDSFTGAQHLLHTKIITDLLSKDSEAWRNAVQFIKGKFNIDPEKIDLIDYNDVLEKAWEDDAALSVNPTETISDKIKDFINTIPLAHPETVKLSEDGKTVTYAKINDNVTGFIETVDFRVMNPKLIELLATANSPEQMLLRLRTYGLKSYNYYGKAILHIYSHLSKPENRDLLNLFYSNYKKQLTSRYTTFLNKQGELIKHQQIVENKIQTKYRLVDEWKEQMFNNLDVDMYDDAWNKEWNDKYVLFSKLYKPASLTEEVAKLLSELYADLGIEVEPQIILHYHKEGIAKADNNSDFISNFLTPLSYLKNIKGEGIIDKMRKDRSVKFDESGNLLRLADKVALFTFGKGVYSNRNVKGQVVYTPQDPDFLSEWIDNLKNEDRISAFEFIKPYTLVEANQHSLLLWGDEIRNNTVVKKGNGFINYQMIGNKKVPYSSQPLNERNIEHFLITDISGIKDLSTGQAKEYKEFTDIEWDILNLTSFINATTKTPNNDVVSLPAVIPSDRGRSRFYTVPRINLSSVVFNHIAGEDSIRIPAKYYTNSPTIKLIESKLHSGTPLTKEETEDYENYLYYKDIIDSPIVKQLVAIAKREIQAAITATKVIFEIDKFGNVVRDENGMPVVRTDAEGQLFYHFSKFDENDKPVYVDKDGNPTGRVFTLNSINFELAGQKYTLNSIKGLVTNGFINTNTSLDGDLERILVNRVLDYMSYEYKSNKPTFDVYETYISSFKSNTTNQSLLGDKTYQNMVAEFLFNTKIYNHEQRALFLGDEADYKSGIDTTKRAGEILASGKVNAGTEQFRAVTIRDVKLVSSAINEITTSIAKALSKQYPDQDYNAANIIAYGINKEATTLPHKFNAYEQAIYDVLKPYFDNDSANAVSFITMDEFKKRLNYFGLTTIYNDLLTKLENGHELTSDDYSRLIQLQKNFYYDYSYNPKLGKFVPTQVKNAEVVLTPTLIKNLQLETLAGVMEDNNISQLNLESAEKVGTLKIATLHDKDGNLVEDAELRMLNAVNSYNYSSLRKQQDITDHIVDEHNKFGKQISKNIITNINANDIYTLNDLRGETVYDGNSLKQRYFNLYSKNIIESANDVLSRIVDNPEQFEDIVNGRVKAKINNTKIRELLKDQALMQGINPYIIKTLENDIRESGNLPIYYNVFYKKWEAILTSLFTNNVIKQPHAGLHAVQMSSLFLRPITGKVSNFVQSKLEGKFDNIEYAQHIIDRGDFRLRTMRDDATGVIKAEVLLPRYSKKFITPNGKLSIDQIKAIDPKILTMLGYRIPTEDKHSMYVFEVVGFLPDDSGAIVLPDDFITQTGADFDIDSVFTMMYNFHKDNTNSLVVDDLNITDRNKLFDNYYRKILTSTKGKEALKETQYFNEDFANGIFSDLHINRKEIEKIFYLKGLMIGRDDFYKKNIKEQQELGETRAARENAILDIMISILSHPAHTKERMTPNGFPDITKAKDIVNSRLAELGAVNEDTVDINSYQGQRIFRSRNISGKTLKAFSVSRDGLLSIFQVASAKLPNPITFTVVVDETNPLRTTKHLSQLYGEDVTFQREGKDTIAHIKVYNLGNNGTGTYTNIDGKLITSYSAEFTANILDGVKEGMPPNINPTTLGWAETLVNIGIPYTEALAFINLPIIRQIANSESNFKSVIRLNRSSRPSTLNATIFTKLYAIANKEGFSIKHVEDVKSISNLVYPSLAEVTELLEFYNRQPNVLRSIDDMLNSYSASVDTMMKENLIDMLQDMTVFMSIDKATSAIRKMAPILGVDKIGAGPTFSVTKKMIDKLASNVNSEENYITVPDGRPLLSAIFNDIDSVYPTLNTFYKYGNLLSYNVLKELFITEIPIFDDTVTTTLERIVDSNINPNRENQIVTYLNKHLVSQLPALNISDKELLRLIGFSKYKRKRFTFSEKDSIDKFKQLSLADKIDFLKKKMAKDNIDLSTHLFGYLFLQRNDKMFERNRYEVIEYKNNDIEDRIIASFAKLWYSENPYERDVARDLVRYAFHVDNFAYTYDSLARVIPPSVLAYEDTGYENDTNRGIGLSQELEEQFTYLTTISNSPAAGVELPILAAVQERFILSNYKDNAFIPDVSGIVVEKESGEKIKVFNPDSNGIISIAKGNISKISNRDRGDIYIKLPKENTENDWTVYRIAPSTEEDKFVYYYPVSKLESFDRSTESIIASNNEAITPDSYLKVIEKYRTEGTENTLSILVADGINISSLAPTELGKQLTNFHMARYGSGKSEFDIVPFNEINGISYPVNPANGKAWIDPKDVIAKRELFEWYYRKHPKNEVSIKTIFGGSVEAWYKANNSFDLTVEDRINMMSALIHMKLLTYPKLYKAIKENGGVEWLKKSSHIVYTERKGNGWEGKGTDSNFINALIEAYNRVDTNTLKSESETATKVNNPNPSKTRNHSMNKAMPADKNLTGKATTTLALVQQGLRIATTRSYPLGKVGDVITFENDPTQYRITKVEQLTEAKVNDPAWIEEWSRKEQWTTQHFKDVMDGKTVHVGSWQTTFEKVVTTSTPKNNINYFDSFWKYVAKGQYSQFINDLRKTHSEAEIDAINKQIREVYIEAFNNNYGDLMKLQLDPDNHTVSVIYMEEGMDDFIDKYIDPSAEVMVGNHGIYFEFDKPTNTGTFVKKHLQYNEYTKDGMKYYEQFKTVNYADYKVGKWYVSIFEGLGVPPLNNEDYANTQAYKKLNPTKKGKPEQLDLFGEQQAKFASNPTNQDLLDAMQESGDLEILCSGGAKAKNGMFIGSKTFGKWEVVTDLKGMPKHSAGGVDLTIDTDGTVSIGGKEGTFKAQDGVFIPNYKTPLSSLEEAQFQQWYKEVAKRKNINSNPDDENHYYDYRGYWKNEKHDDILKEDSDAHFIDKYKVPGHPTFSNESKYHSQDTPGGTWSKDKDGISYFTHSPYTEKYAKRTVEYLDGTNEYSIYKGDTIRNANDFTKRNKQLLNMATGGIIDNDPTKHPLYPQHLPKYKKEPITPVEEDLSDAVISRVHLNARKTSPFNFSKIPNKPSNIKIGGSNLVKSLPIVNLALDLGMLLVDEYEISKSKNPTELRKQKEEYYKRLRNKLDNNLDSKFDNLPKSL